MCDQCAKQLMTLFSYNPENLALHHQQRSTRLNRLNSNPILPIHQRSDELQKEQDGSQK